MDLASSIQQVTEEVVLRLARTARKELSTEYLCLAGGVALNCVANGKVLRDGMSRYLGAAGRRRRGWSDRRGAGRMAFLHDGPRAASEGDRICGAYLGPSFTMMRFCVSLRAWAPVYQHCEEDELIDRVAKVLADGAVVGWFQGRMEFGPRALGSRSILGDARNSQMQSTMNLKIKYRESFRPFAPAVLAEQVSNYFELDRPSPYMALVAPVREDLRVAPNAGDEHLFGIAKLNRPRSRIPAVTHVDYSARIQTVHRETNPRFHQLLSRFEALTGCGLLVNTSFNVRGEPIVCTPEDAYRCFISTEMDYLAIGSYLLTKADQPVRARDDSWRRQFAMD